MATEKVYTASESYESYDRTDRISVFGGEQDTWQALLTPEIVNDPSFAIAFDADVGTGLLRVDSVTAEIFYTVPHYTTADLVVALPPWGNSYLQDGSIGVDQSGTRLFFVVGQHGLIKSSTDGVDWVEHDSNTISTLRSVASLDYGTVAVGDSGVIRQTSDRALWSEGESQVKDSLFAVVFHPWDRTMIAAGNNGLIHKTEPVRNLWVPARRGA